MFLDSQDWVVKVDIRAGYGFRNCWKMHAGFCVISQKLKFMDLVQIIDRE